MALVSLSTRLFFSARYFASGDSCSLPGATSTTWPLGFFSSLGSGFFWASARRCCSGRSCSRACVLRFLAQARGSMFRRVTAWGFFRGSPPGHFTETKLATSRSPTTAR